MVSLQQQVAYFQEQATVQNYNYQAVKASSAMFEQRNSDLLFELEVVQGTMKTLLDDKTSEIAIGTLEGTVAELSKEVANLQSHDVYLSTRIKAQEITYNALAHDHRRLKETVKNLKIKATDLDNGALFEAIKDTEAKAVEVYAQNTELCKMLATLQASYNTLENTIALLTSRNSEMSGLLQKANADVDALRSETSQLRGIVENSDAKAASFQKHNQYLSESIEIAEKKVVTLVDKVLELESHNRTLGNTNSHLSERIRKLEVDAANLKHQNDSFVKELELAKAEALEKTILESRLQIIKVNNGFLDGKNNHLMAENASVNKDLEITHAWARLLWDQNSILIENAKIVKANVAKSIEPRVQNSDEERLKLRLIRFKDTNTEPKLQDNDNTHGSKSLTLKSTKGEKGDEEGYDQGRDISSTLALSKEKRAPVHSTMRIKLRRT